MLAKQPTIIPMKRLLLCLLLVAPSAPIGAQQPGVDQNAELLIVPPDEKILRWHGYTGRTYFLQFSTGNNPLVDWHWVPIIESGIGSEISYEVGGTGPRGFYRLQYTDDVRPSGISLEDWDVDGDNLGNLDEVGFYQTNPLAADTDGDGLTDWEETSNYYTNPRLKDTDGDGMEDYDEVIVYLTDPWSVDTDNDGVNDLEEVSIHFTDPWNVDSDADGMRDGWEVTYGLDPLDPGDALGDLDSDGIPSGIEYELNLNPALVDTDGDAIPDGDEDPDRDELSNFSEIAVHASDPQRWDTDRDGMPDGWEVASQLSPTDGLGANGSSGDPDGDNLSNFEEWLNGTAPDNPDTDGDGTNDGAENTQGSNPNDDSDNGGAPPAKDLVEIPFTVSDPSGSESEKWKMTIVGKGPQDTRTTSLASVEFGEPATKTIKLRKWNRYEITVEHLATDPNPPVNGETDYDWDATVDGLPTSQSFEKTETTVGVNNFFVIGKYWLVDNRRAVFTTEKHGNEENIVSGKKAILVPINMRDNLPETGVDNVSVTANEDAGGYQEKFWIMAQNGGPEFSNDMHFQIHPEPATELAMTCPDAAIDPTAVTLNEEEPKVNWRGAINNSEDKQPAFQIGEEPTDINLPIGVKCMKRRTIRLKVYRVTEDGGPGGVDNDVDLAPSANELEDYLNNKVFGPQINTIFDVEMPESPLLIDWKTQNDPMSWLDVGPPDENSGDQQLFVDAISGENGELPEDADIVIFLVGANLAFGGELGAVGVTNRIERLCWVLGDARNGGPADPNPYDSIGDVMRTIAHEIGHVLVDYGHPDTADDEGHAPLPGTDQTRRLMVSGLGGGPNPGVLLVKREWDEAETWLAAKISPGN